MLASQLKLGSARLSSARLGSAQLGSARLGSAHSLVQAQRVHATEQLCVSATSGIMTRSH